MISATQDKRIQLKDRKMEGERALDEERESEEPREKEKRSTK